MAWSRVTREPLVQEALDNPPQQALVADVGIRGVWQPQATAMFDIRVIDSDAPSYLEKSPQTVLKSAENEKKTKYSAACVACHVSFTPLCLTIDGLLGNEMITFTKRLADQLSLHSEQPYRQYNVLDSD